MTYEEIIRGNKLIAVFMGWTCRYQRGCRLPFLTEKEAARIDREVWVVTEHWGMGEDFTNNNEEATYEPHALQFHSSYDWLMLAWKKIRYQTSVRFHKATEWGNITGNHCARAILYGTVEEAFHEIVKAIEWLSKNPGVQVSDTTKMPDEPNADKQKSI